MILWLVDLLCNVAPGHWSASVQNLLGYVSVRTALSAASTFTFGLILAPRLIRSLSRADAGQPVRSGESIHPVPPHQAKAGTPTMGGVLIVSAVFAATVLWADLGNRLIWTALLTLLALGGLGCADDLLKLRRKNHRGLPGRLKLLFQILVGLAMGVSLYVFPVTENYQTHLSIPFFKSVLPNLGMLYIPFVAIVITGSSNAVNLSDGLDGLAIGCTVACAAAFGALAYVIGRSDWCAELYLLHIRGAGELPVFAAALVGAGLSFLWFNAHPAQLFMGDTGSLALGGALATVAVLLKQEALLLIIGGVFVVEAISVILQVISFRTTGKRVFLMSPLHHHFEMKGWHESQIVIRFWILAGILGMLGLVSIKLR